MHLLANCVLPRAMHRPAATLHAHHTHKSLPAASYVHPVHATGRSSQHQNMVMHKGNPTTHAYTHTLSFTVKAGLWGSVLLLSQPFHLSNNATAATPPHTVSGKLQGLTTTTNKWTHVFDHLTTSPSGCTEGAYTFNLQHRLMELPGTCTAV